MHISLIGMSGSGKSHWSKKLAEKGFTVFCIDDLIETKLGSELKKLGYSGINDVSKWMGQPYDERFAGTSQKYLAFENEAMQEVFAYLKKSTSEKILIDTTGSVIYLDKLLLKTLSKLTRIVYLETPQSVQDEMYNLYIKDPKPVIWGNSFSKIDGETNLDALARCYSELLAYRTKEYNKLAHVTMNYHTLRKSKFTVEDFIVSI